MVGTDRSDETLRLRATLASIAPGTALRDGLERILRGRTGALIVLGQDKVVESLSTGGFTLDVPFTATGLRELAKMDGAIPALDANDLIYQIESSRSYNPWPKLEAIKAPLTWINSADDFINPRNLDFPRRALARMPQARFRLIPESAATHGHGTHTWARFWKSDLRDLLARTARP